MHKDDVYLKDAQLVRSGLSVLFLRNVTNATVDALTYMSLED
jgi:hypothetical protein